MAKIDKVKVSELPRVEDVEGFWIFGYKIENSIATSVKVAFDKLLDVIRDAAKDVQLERRMVVAMERTTQKLPVAEKMDVYKIVARNVNKLEIVVLDGSNKWINIPLINGIAENLDIKLTGQYDIVVKVEPAFMTNISVETLATATIFAVATPYRI